MRRPRKEEEEEEEEATRLYFALGDAAATAG
jgi:hypothetical protein